MHYDYDYIIIGSGFGGSVSALRLAEKSYKVMVIEAGKCYAPQDFAKSSWNLKRFLWMPRFGLSGILRINFFKHVVVLSGSGVGGGSLVYANTLMKPKSIIWKNGSWRGLHDWANALDPFYEKAKTMLGFTTNNFLGQADKVLKKSSNKHFSLTDVAVYFHGDKKLHDDPYFNGKGPKRSPCTLCGACMVGCRDGGKNTLDKNYLYLAEKHGANVLAETQVSAISPLNNQLDGSDGYLIETHSSLNKLSSKKRYFKVRGVIVAAGVLGTLKLLLHCKKKGLLPLLSDQLGKNVLTNAESLIGVRSMKKDIDFATGIAIGSSCYIDETTHIQAVRYPKGSDSMGLLTTIMTERDTRAARLKNLGLLFLKRPLHTLRHLNPIGFAKSSMILLVMQTTPASLTMKLKYSRWFPTRKKLITSGQAIPAYVPQANQFAQKIAAELGATALTSWTELLLNKPMTAHILGGASIGENDKEGVIDAKNNVFNYINLYICDGSMIAANLGVNPSLTITALTEHAMSFIKDNVDANF